MGKSGLVVGTGLWERRGAEGDAGAKPGDTVQPALTARGAQVGQMRRPVVGVGVFLAGCGAEEVEVDAVHDLRPSIKGSFEMPENQCYFDSGISLGRKLSLRVLLAGSAFAVLVARL
jgi:hypothetical protein